MPGGRGWRFDVKWPLMIVTALFVATLVWSAMEVGFWGVFSHVDGVVLLALGVLVIFLARGEPGGYWRRWRSGRSTRTG